MGHSFYRDLWMIDVTAVQPKWQQTLILCQISKLIAAPPCSIPVRIILSLQWPLSFKSHWPTLASYNNEPVTLQGWDLWEGGGASDKGNMSNPDVWSRAQCVVVQICTLLFVVSYNNGHVRRQTQPRFTTLCHTWMPRQMWCNDKVMILWKRWCCGEFSSMVVAAVLGKGSLYRKWAGRASAQHDCVVVCLTSVHVRLWEPKMRLVWEKHTSVNVIVSGQWLKVKRFQQWKTQ